MEKINTEMAEALVLGSMLQDPRALTAAKDLLIKDYFYNNSYAEFFNVMISMVGPVDELLLREEIKKRKIKSLFCCTEKISWFIEKCISPANVEQYCKIVIDHYKRRQETLIASELTSGDITADDAAHRLRIIHSEVREQNLENEMLDAIEGKRDSILLPWDFISYKVCPLIPGTVTIICGSPGSTKSLVLLQVIRFLNHGGVKCSVLEMEDSKNFHLRRIMAQISGFAGITNDRWCKEHPEETKSILYQNKEELNLISNSIEIPQFITPKALIAWVHRKADEGCRVISIDPITAMERGKFPWNDDHEFMMGAKKIIEKYGISLLLISHPRKLQGGNTKVTLDDVSGGITYQRFSQTILYLMAHDEKNVIIKDECGTFATDVDRSMYIMKARNSAYRNKIVGFSFCTKSLTLKEKGLIFEERE